MALTLENWVKQCFPLFLKTIAAASLLEMS
jgi:hypothetical protein